MRTKILTAAILALSAAGVQAAEKPLKILLVNDDGCQSVGTTSLQEKLAAKGYDVPEPLPMRWILACGAS